MTSDRLNGLERLRGLQFDATSLRQEVLARQAAKVRSELEEHLKVFDRDIKQVPRLLKQSTIIDEKGDEAQIKVRELLYELSGRLCNSGDADLQRALGYSEADDQRVASLIIAAIDRASRRLAEGGTIEHLKRSFALRDEMPGGDDWGMYCMPPQILAAYRRLLASMEKVRGQCLAVFERDVCSDLARRSYDEVTSSGD